MPKPKLQEPFHSLESQMIETFLAGCKIYRPDLDYPQSYSDMQAGIRALLKMFDIKRQAISRELPITDD